MRDAGQNKERTQRDTSYKVTVTFFFLSTTNGACGAATVDKERKSGCRDTLATFTTGSVHGTATQSAETSAFMAAAETTVDKLGVSSHLPLPLPFLPFLPLPLASGPALEQLDAPWPVFRQRAHWCENWGFFKHMPCVSFLPHVPALNE